MSATAQVPKRRPLTNIQGIQRHPQQRPSPTGLSHNGSALRSCLGSTKPGSAAHNTWAVRTVIHLPTNTWGPLTASWQLEIQSDVGGVKAHGAVPHLRLPHCRPQGFSAYQNSSTADVMRWRLAASLLASEKARPQRHVLLSATWTGGVKGAAATEVEAGAEARYWLQHWHRARRLLAGRSTSQAGVVWRQHRHCAGGRRC